jgi:hypothetical protein
VVSDGIKVAQSQARYSPLISSTWTPNTFRTATILSAVKQAAIRVNQLRAGRRPMPAGFKRNV